MPESLLYTSIPQHSLSPWGNRGRDRDSNSSIFMFIDTEYTHTKLYTCPPSHSHLSISSCTYPCLFQCEKLRVFLGRTLIKTHKHNLSLHYPFRLLVERKIEDGKKESGESFRILSTFSQLSEYYFRHEFVLDAIPVVLYYILTFALPIPHDDGKHVNAILVVWWTFWKSGPYKYTCALVLTCACSFRWVGTLPRLLVRANHLMRFSRNMEDDVNVSAKMLQVMKLDMQS